VSTNTSNKIKNDIDDFTVVSLAEVAGKVSLGSGFATSVRPRKYYKISKETMETSLDDIEQLINFFVIEAQRIVFAENVIVTGAVSWQTLINVDILTLHRRPLLHSSDTT
jgi:hypothetical protein